MKDPTPRAARRLMTWSLAPWERPVVLGDLQEEFRDISDAAGEQAARRWYWQQAAMSVWPNLLRRLRGDQRRRQLFGRGAWAIASGLLWTVMAAWRTGYWLVALPYFLVGAAIVLHSVFSKRVHVRYRWPWRTKDPAPQEFLVRPKSASLSDRDVLLTLGVPNVPLGLSGLALCRPRSPADAVAPSVVHANAPIIARTFTDAQSVRVLAIVNLTGGPARADVDVVDASGRVARSVPCPVTVGRLEQVVQSWDDIADEDPADHFGQVDVTVPLAGLASGAYRLRITADDGVASSRREETILVQPSLLNPSIDRAYGSR